jgi:two-component sensor histidine kinase
VAFQLRDSDQVALEVEALDSEGEPAAATTTFASSDEDIVTVRDNGDGTALAIASPGAAGLGTATVTATVTQKSSGDTLEGTFDIEVVAGDAVTVNVVAGTPEPKAETPATTPDGA